MKHDVLGVLCGAYREHGDVYCLEILGRKQIFVLRPEHVHEVLVDRAEDLWKNRDYTDPRAGLAKFLGNGLLTSNGAFWKRQRRLVAPVMHHKRIASYAGTMVGSVEHMLATWRDGQDVDVGHDMMSTTLDIVAKCLFRADVSGDTRTIAHAMAVLQDMVEATNSAQAMLPPWFPTPLRVREWLALRELDKVVYRLIAERRAASSPSAATEAGDLLSMLLLAEDEDGKRMTDRQARDELVTMVLAGHETTSNALSWTWILLSRHPQVEARLHAEIDAVLGGRPPSFEDLKRLPYAEMVLKESLRLYPPAYAYSRVAVKDMTIGGFEVAAGLEVTVMPYATHRDPRWWERPDEFDPERFSPENEARIPRFAWIPFGGGPRVCVGNAFAMMEALILLVMVASRYRLRCQENHEIRTDPGLTLRLGGGLSMKLSARGPATAVAQPGAAAAP